MGLSAFSRSTPCPLGYKLKTKYLFVSYGVVDFVCSRDMGRTQNQYVRAIKGISHVMVLQFVDKLLGRAKTDRTLMSCIQP